MEVQRGGLQECVAGCGRSAGCGGRGILGWREGGALGRARRFDTEGLGVRVPASGEGVEGPGSAVEEWGRAEGERLDSVGETGKVEGRGSRWSDAGNI